MWQTSFEGVEADACSSEETIWPQECSHRYLVTSVICCVASMEVPDGSVVSTPD